MTGGFREFHVYGMCKNASHFDLVYTVSPDESLSINAIKQAVANIHSCDKSTVVIINFEEIPQ